MSTENYGLGLGTTTIDAAQRLLAIACGSLCPVTSGQPLRVTRPAWDKLCAAKRKSGVPYGMMVFGNQRFRKPYNRCKTCKGKDIPKEVAFIAAAEVAAISQHINIRREQAEQSTSEGEQMAGRAIQSQRCEGCGKTKALSMCSGELLCSTCASLSGVLSKDPRSVALRAIRRDVAEALLGHLITGLGVDWFVDQAKRYLPEEVSVELSNETLEAIAEVVGYTGKDADELVALVEKIHTENMAATTTPSTESVSSVYADAVRSLEHMADVLVRRESALWELVDATTEIIADRDEIHRGYSQLFEAVKEERKAHGDLRIELCRALTGLDTVPLPSDEQLVAMAATSEAMLEEIQRETNQILGLRLNVPDIVRYISLQRAARDHHTSFLISLRRTLGIAIGPVEELLTAVRTKSAQVEELAKSAQSALGRQEEAEQQLLADEQIFARMREVLGDDSLANGDLPTAVEMLFASQRLGPLAEIDQAENHALNSRLLELLLDFPEVGVERIAAIREVA